MCPFIEANITFSVFREYVICTTSFLDYLVCDLHISFGICPRNDIPSMYLSNTLCIVGNRSFLFVTVRVLLAYKKTDDSALEEIGIQTVIQMFFEYIFNFCSCLGIYLLLVLTKLSNPQFNCFLPQFDHFVTFTNFMHFDFMRQILRLTAKPRVSHLSTWLAAELNFLQ